MVGALVLLVSAMPALSGERLVKEQKIKAAYLFNFTKYIEWPDKDGSGQAARVAICINDFPPFLDFLTDLVTGRRVGRSQAAVEVYSLDQSSACDIIFSHHAFDPPPSEHNGALIVADSGSIDVPGAAIVFFVEENRVRFFFQQDNLVQLNVLVSSELRKLARSGA
jgi:hypothetical protein